jgi:ribosomal protein S18 acetylase RimI-like enzyme
MSAVVRRARSEDADSIRNLGLGDPAFQVSERIPFYEREELVEWASAPRDNLLFVAEADGCIVGFFFCKVMSQHWAMLDNFYVVPSSRGTGVVDRLRRALTEALQQRGIVYLSTLVAKGDPGLSAKMSRYGFTQSKDYEWMERFL